MSCKDCERYQNDIIKAGMENVNLKDEIEILKRDLNYEFSKKIPDIDQQLKCFEFFQGLTFIEAGRILSNFAKGIPIGDCLIEEYKRFDKTGKDDAFTGKPLC